MNKLQDLQFRMGFEEGLFMDTSTPIDIFHYTSPGGFESILFSNEERIELWASRFDCLNDMSEGTVAQERFVAVCNQMLSSGKLSEEMHSFLSSTTPPHTTLITRMVGDTFKITRPEFVQYVCSFSKNPDSLAMWNYYSKGSKYEGFNLGFFTDSLCESIKKSLSSYECNVYLYPVIYDQEKQESLIRDFLCQLLECYEEGDEHVIKYMVSEQLLKWSLVFKHECFKHEEEVRLIVYVGIDKSHSQTDAPQLPVYYRITNGYTIPYIKIHFEKDCLSYATVGPLTCDDNSKAAQVAVLDERLSAAGYCAIGQHSKVPVRY